MKYLLTVLFAFTCVLVQAQTDTNHIIGTWELTQLTYNNQSTTPQQSNFKRYKIITPTHFMVLDINAKTNVIRTSIFGTYSLSNGTYIEKVVHVNQESSGMIGSQNSFKVKFEGDNGMSQTGGFNGLKSDEKWTKVQSSPLEK